MGTPDTAGSPSGSSPFKLIDGRPFGLILGVGSGLAAVEEVCGGGGIPGGLCSSDGTVGDRRKSEFAGDAFLLRS